MKAYSLQSLVCLVVIICWACTNRHGLSQQFNTVDTVCNANDTNILSQKVPKELVDSNVREIEYVININNNNYSPAILFSESVDKLIIKMQPFIGDYSVENLNDTNAVGVSDIKSPVQLTSSAEICTLIRKVLDRASTEFDLRKTERIIFEFALFEEDAKQLSDKYARTYGLDHDFNNMNMANLIKQSALFKQLSSLFNHFAIEISKVSVEDMMLCMSSDNNIMLDAIICLETKR